MSRRKVLLLKRSRCYQLGLVSRYKIGLTISETPTNATHQARILKSSIMTHVHGPVVHHKISIDESIFIIWYTNFFLTNGPAQKPCMMRATPAGSLRLRCTPRLANWKMIQRTPIRTCTIPNPVSCRDLSSLMFLYKSCLSISPGWATTTTCTGCAFIGCCIIHLKWKRHSKITTVLMCLKLYACVDELWACK